MIVTYPFILVQFFLMFQSTEPTSLICCEL
jgi:hypothetical protein